MKKRGVIVNYNGNTINSDWIIRVRKYFDLSDEFPICVICFCYFIDLGWYQSADIYYKDVIEFFNLSDGDKSPFNEERHEEKMALFKNLMCPFRRAVLLANAKR